jgi:CDP-4-dehydro-6-deoxyglucose reductase, E3
MSEPRSNARVVAVRDLSPSVRALSLDLGEPPFALRAGQWINLYVPTASGVAKRAYSVASAPQQRPVEIAVTHVVDGVVSPVLHGLGPGSELGWDGPHGFFTRDGASAECPALFVGTGTGVCPLRSMLAELLAGEHPPVTLLFGVRTAGDILYREEFERWAERDPTFRLEVTLSRPDANWDRRTGYVQAHVAELAQALGQPHVFICGLSRMVGEVRALCKSELGLDRKRIHSERYD